MHPSTNDIWKIPCPSCGAEKHSRCRDTSFRLGTQFVPTDFHQARIDVAIRVMEAGVALTKKGIEPVNE